MQNDHDYKHCYANARVLYNAVFIVFTDHGIADLYCYDAPIYNLMYEKTPLMYKGIYVNKISSDNRLKVKQVYKVPRM